MEKKKKEKILNQVKMDRAARRKADIEAGIKLPPHLIEQKTKKDQFDKSKNTIKEWEE